MFTQPSTWASKQRLSPPEMMQGALRVPACSSGPPTPSLNVERLLDLRASCYIGLESWCSQLLEVVGFQNLQHLGAGPGRAVKLHLPVLSFSCLNHKGKRDPTQPLPSAHIQSESTHSAADSQFPTSIFRVPGPTLPSHATSQLELHHTMELQPRWSLQP